MNTIEKLLAKGAEYYECARHINLRGAKDVLDECKPLIEEIKREGKTFDSVLLIAADYAGEPIDLEKDEFLTRVKPMFEAK